MPYQLFGAPWCKKLMLYRLWSSLCQQKVAKSMPIYSQGLQTRTQGEPMTKLTCSAMRTA